MQQSALVVNFTILLAVALVGGMVAHRLRQPIILGYLLVGVIVGPHALGVVQDVAFVEGAATIGVALLMLTLGLEVSFAQLKQAGSVGLWGGIAQILITALLAAAAGVAIFGWSWSEGIVLGLIISLSSTMVCLKILMDRGELDSLHGRIMIAILILQDISVVLMIVVEPVLGKGGTNLPLALGTALLSIVLFVGIAVVAGAWVLPWLMGRIGGVRSRELFLLTVLVICLGAALGTQVVGLSAVFGAFLIGMVLRETKFAHQALAEVTPLRDIFAALFFVSLGMLLDPSFVAANWGLVVVAVGLIFSIKFLTVFGIVRFFGYSGGVALLAGAGLIQIGEFGFILAQQGVNMGIVLPQHYSLIIGSAIISMLLTPLSMGIVSRLYGRLAPGGLSGLAQSPPGSTQMQLAEPTGDIVIAGFGRIGQSVAHSLSDAGIPYSVVEIDPEVVFKVRCDGVACIYGDASNMHVLSQIDLSNVKVLVVTFPDPIAVLTTVRAALDVNPKIKIVARVHRTREAKILTKLGIEDQVSPEYEASLEFLRKVLIVTGRSKDDIRTIMGAATRDKEVVELAQDDKHI
ncbi:MAG: cation:proton antiporter [Dehalococcoidia bacterium]|nr:cation:proton antiporter [Dehalococcoidia bacterium]